MLERKISKKQREKTNPKNAFFYTIMGISKEKYGTKPLEDE